MSINKSMRERKLANLQVCSNLLRCDSVGEGKYLLCLHVFAYVVYSQLWELKIVTL